jgi:hypothetical protein
VSDVDSLGVVDSLSGRDTPTTAMELGDVDYKHFNEGLLDEQRVITASSRRWKAAATMGAMGFTVAVVWFSLSHADLKAQLVVT